MVYVVAFFVLFRLSLLVFLTYVLFLELIKIVIALFLSQAIRHFSRQIWGRWEFSFGIFERFEQFLESVVYVDLPWRDIILVHTLVQLLLQAVSMGHGEGAFRIATCVFVLDPHQTRSTLLGREIHFGPKSSLTLPRKRRHWLVEHIRKGVVLVRLW